jgi:hypothetical protein
MEDIAIGEETVLKRLAKLKVDRYPGLDKLHPRLLVEVRNEIKELVFVNVVYQMISNDSL